MPTCIPHGPLFAAKGKTFPLPQKTLENEWLLTNLFRRLTMADRGAAPPNAIDDDRQRVALLAGTGEHGR